jgi:hypothetical protein
VECDTVQIINVMKVTEGNLSRYDQLLEDTTREACSVVRSQSNEQASRR